LKKLVVITDLNTRVLNETHCFYFSEWFKTKYIKIKSFNNGMLHTTPLYDKYYFEQVYQYTNEIYERNIPKLSEALNIYHNENLPTFYWKILIGPWFRHFISIFYDRYLNLSIMFNPNEEVEIKNYSMNQDVIPNNMLDFYNLIKSDEYNYQIYKAIFLKIFKIDNNNENKDLDQSNMINIKQKYKKRGNFFEILSRFFYKDKNVMIKNSYFSKKDLVRLFFISKFRIFPGSLNFNRNSFDENVDPNRKTFFLKSNNKNIFENILSECIKDYIPKIFIENYKNLKSKADIYKNRPKVILSANSWYFDEFFCHIAGLSKLENGKLLSNQHGGNYGIEKYVGDHEIKIADRYYSWGWELLLYNNIKPLPSTKLYFYHKFKANKLEKILFVSTSYPRFVIDHVYNISYNFSNYLEDQKVFIGQLNQTTLDKIRFRIHREDNGWNIKEQLLDVNNNLTFESWEIPFSKSLMASSLYICDHLSTTFIEALNLNIPTILFWRDAYYNINNEFSHYIEDLKKVGILYDNPIKAANFIEKIIQNPGDWWMDNRIQNVVNTFKKKFAYNNKKKLNIWATELLEVLNNNQRED
jgi:putative transferase (TIGR04331 family)